MTDMRDCSAEFRRVFPGCCPQAEGPWWLKSGNPVRILGMG